MIQLPLFVLGILGLWGGTLLTVRGAVELSDRYGLSHGFIGLAVLAVGTDLPELVVALSGSVKQLQGIEASGVIVGTAFGSAITQGTLVLGVAGLFGYMPVAPRMVWRDGLTLLLAIGLAAAVVADGAVHRAEGAVMLLAYAIYFVALLQAEQHGKGAGDGHPPPKGVLSAPFAVALGLVTVTLSAHVVVTEGIAFAAALGMSQTLLGVVFVGAGTSLPELALSVQAARQKHASLSVGNVIGSNVFDLLVPIGTAAVVHPLIVDDSTIVFDFPALALVTLALLYFLVRRRGLQRREAMALLALYAGYAGLRVMLG